MTVATSPDEPQPDEPQPDEVVHDLELTLSALRDGVPALGFAGALVEVTRWQDRLDGTDAPALEEMGGLLAELHGELESDAPDQQVIARLLGELGTRTLAVADLEPDGNRRTKLTELGHLLHIEFRTLVK